MKGQHNVLALTHTEDEITGERKPLFAVPVQVCKASDSQADVKLDNAAPSGSTYSTQYVDDGTGEVFDFADRIKGVRVGDEFKPIDAESLSAIDEATKLDTMYVLGRVERDSLPWDRVTGRYLLQSPAKGGSPKAFRLVYEALVGTPKKGKVAAKPAMALVAKRTATSRQKLVAIYADDAGALVMVELLFAAQVKAADDAVTAHMLASVDEAMVAKARAVVEGLADGSEALAAEVDEAVAMKQELVDQAVAGMTIEAPKKAAPKAVESDLEAMLAASIEAVAA
jgi:non-homologous end joining protein Ku